MIPLYPKSRTNPLLKHFNFKERLVNVKLKDIDAWTHKALVQKLGDRTNQNSQTSELILEHRTGQFK